MKTPLIPARTSALFVFMSAPFASGGGVPALDQTDRSASNIQTCLVVSTMAKKSLAPRRRSARERLLAAADELFYGAGINTVGIDRVIEHAGVAKASLYDCFGSKEGLIRARSEEHTSELQSLAYLVCRLLLEKKKKQTVA